MYNSPLITMTRQLIYYLASPVPAPPGRGFDRWFVLLDKAGVANGTLVLLIGLEAVSFIFFSRWLLDILRATATNDRM